MQADRGYSDIRKTLDGNENMHLKFQVGIYRKSPHCPLGDLPSWGKAFPEKGSSTVNGF